MGVALHLNRLKSPSPKDSLCKVGSSGEEDENGKSLRQQQQQQQQQQQWRRWTTDKMRSEKLTWAFGSGELKS